MTHALVSVIMPVFNSERWLAQSIESALAQSWKRIELLIVDDGSSDASVSIAERHAAGNVRILRQENQGASVARNTALAVAQGDYIQYLDADDLLDPEKIERQLASLSDAPRSVATCAWGRFVESPASADLVPTELWNDMAPADFLVAAYTHGNFMPNHAWLVPRAVATDAGGWAPMRSRNDDAEYFAKVVLASDRILFVPGARAYYRSGHAGLSAARDRAAIDGYRWTLDRISERLLAYEDSPRSRGALATSYDHFVRTVEDEYPALARDAEGRVRELAGSRFVPAMTRRPVRILTRLFGRTAAQHVVRSYRRLKRKVSG